MTELNYEIYNFYLKTKGGWGVVSGKSMESTLKEGWKIKIKPSDKDKIKVGDIVLFGKDTSTCHRIIGKIKFFGHRYFIHKGDNSSIGGIFEAKDLVGRVVEVFDNEGEKIDKQKWRYNSSKSIKTLSYIYLFMYLVKRFIWGKEINWLSGFVNRFFWKRVIRFVS